MRTVRMLAVALAACCAAPAAAQEGGPVAPEPARAGTAEDAAALRRTLESAVTEAPFRKGILRVEPDAAGLRVVVGAEPLLQLLPGARDIRVAPVSYVVSERTDGDWNVFSDSPLALSFTHAATGTAETVAYGVDALRFKGVFAPAIGLFRRADTVLEGVATSTTDAVSTSGNTILRASATSQARPVGDGAADIEFTYREEGSNQVVSLGGASQPGLPALPAIEFEASVGSTEMTGTARAARTRAVLELYLAAIRQSDALQSDVRATLAGPFGAELKERIGALLPLWDEAGGSAKASDIALRSDYGTLTAAAATQEVRLTGLSGATSLDTDLAADGLALDSPLVPGWARDLVPEEMRIALRIEGGDLEPALRLALAEADFAADALWSPEAAASIADLLEADAVRLVLKPSRLTSPLLDLAVSGALGFEDAQPSGEVLVSADGLDRTIETLQAAAAADPSLFESVGMLQIAKGFARPAADGRLEWRTRIEADGSVSVNGTVLKGPDLPPTAAPDGSDL